MQISNISFPLVLCASLFATAAMAEGIAVTDREHRKGMSYEEYSEYREKMRMQMNKIQPENSSKPPDLAEKPNRDSEYGKGYHARSPSQDRPDKADVTRPERPRAERFNRGDMGRR